MRLPEIVQRAHSTLRRLIDRVDPGDVSNEDVEPISIGFAVLFLAACAFSVFILYGYAYEPGRDVGYHMFCTRVVSEMGTSSPLAARYEPLHPTEANTLMYGLGGLLGKIVGAPAAFRFLRLLFFLGLPCTTFWVLRKLGRSPWSALLSFPMEYTQSYVAGFANFQFAAPIFVAGLYAFHRLLEQPTRRRAYAVGALTAIAFVAHAHIYMWMGALYIVLAIHSCARGLIGDREDERELRDRARGVLRKSGFVVASVLPSLLLFYLWYRRTFGAGHHISGVAATPSTLFGAKWEPIARKVMEGPRWGTDVTHHETEQYWVVLTGLLIVVALLLLRREKARSPMFLEACAFITFASYWFLPDSLAGQQLSLRAWDMSAWLVPFLVMPVAVSTGRIARWLVIASIVVFSFGRMQDVRMAVKRFNENELEGFDAMIAAAPKGDHVVAWAVSHIDSEWVHWLPFYEWHQMFGAMTGIEAPLYDLNRDSNSPVRYVTGPPAKPALMIDNPDWGAHPGLWDGHDLVLVRRWNPNPEQLERVRARAKLLAAAGDFQLWQRIDTERAP